MHALPPHSRLGSGQRLPEVSTRSLPGGDSRTWLLRASRVVAPMGPRAPQGAAPRGIVLAQGYGCNVWDVDHNRFVDLAAGFGSLLLGHSHPAVLRALELQSGRLMQALGDVYPSDAKIGLMRRLAELVALDSGRVILGQSGADAVSAALKTAMLHTGKGGVIAFEGSYHGLAYGPLSVCGLRESYRAPFQSQLNPEVCFVPYPVGDQVSEQLELTLKRGGIGAVLVEPVLGRGGVRPLSAAALAQVAELTRRYGALLIADEIWTGLGRAGSFLYCEELGTLPDVVCLGKGLGGGVPLSACLASERIMQAWSREAEVVHTSTFAGAPLACACALATIDILRRHKLLTRSRSLGERWCDAMRHALSGLPVEVRGRGLMVAVDLGNSPGAAWVLMQRLLARGYLASTGGGAREVLVFTPPLIVDEALLEAFTPVLRETLEEWCECSGIGQQ